MHHTPQHNFKMPQEKESAKTTNPEQIERKKRAEEFHARGYEARKQGNYDVAIAQYTEALKIMPYHFKALFNRGFAFDKIGEF